MLATFLYMQRENLSARRKIWNPWPWLTSLGGLSLCSRPLTGAQSVTRHRPPFINGDWGQVWFSFLDMQPTCGACSARLCWNWLCCKILKRPDRLFKIYFQSGKLWVFFNFRNYFIFIPCSKNGCCNSKNGCNLDTQVPRMDIIFYFIKSISHIN